MKTPYDMLTKLYTELFWSHKQNGCHANISYDKFYLHIKTRISLDCFNFIKEIR